MDHVVHRNGSVRYKIRWQGWGPESDQWRWKSELKHCKELLKEYEANAEWEVENIVEHVIHFNAVIRYKVHWKGTSTKDDRWKWDHELEHCGELIGEYWAQNQYMDLEYRRGTYDAGK